MSDETADEILAMCNADMKRGIQQTIDVGAAKFRELGASEDLALSMATAVTQRLFEDQCYGNWHGPSHLERRKAT